MLLLGLPVSTDTANVDHLHDCSKKAEKQKQLDFLCSLTLAVLKLLVFYLKIVNCAPLRPYAVVEAHTV